MPFQGFTKEFLQELEEKWQEEDRRRMRAKAMAYWLRQQMDGEVIKATGEVVAKESS